MLTHAQFIVMFRNRFDDAFPRSSPSFGPQELEYDITEPVPGSRAEGFLCGILGLLLNRKQDVKYATTAHPIPGLRPNGIADLLWVLGQDTIIELWKKPLPPIGTNGPRSGRARTPWAATALLPP